MFKPLRTLTVGLAIVVGGLVAPLPAMATIPTSGEKLIWQNRSTNFCLGVAGGNVTNGTPIIVWQCNNNTDQTWTAESVNSDGLNPFYLRNGTNRNKCLSVNMASKDDGAGLMIWDCVTGDRTNGQQWLLIGGELPGCTRAFNANSVKAMGVEGAKTNQGARVIQWTYLAHGDQEWCTHPAPIN